MADTSTWQQDLAEAEARMSRFFAALRSGAGAPPSPLPAPGAHTRPSSTPAATSAGGGLAAFQPQWPVDFESFLSALLAADDAGEVAPYFDRGYSAVAAGSTKVIFAGIPSGSTGFIVYRHSMFLNPGQESAAVTCTHQQDTQAPLIANAVMTAPLVVAGAFLFPAANRIVHTVVNSGTLDVGFNDDAQVATVTLDYYQAVVQPILSANKAFAQKLARGIVLSSTGGAVA